MKSVLEDEFIDETMEVSLSTSNLSIGEAVEMSWARIAPFWPLKNLIAVNPVSGFEELPFNEALAQANAYFQQPELPLKMQEVNRQTIKWLQAFFDAGQSTIRMPLRELGLLKSTLSLIRFDDQVHQNNKHKIKWLEKQFREPEEFIAEALIELEIEEADQELFLTLMLTTLPGWAAYLQYRAGWAQGQDAVQQTQTLKSEYLALRLALTCLIWPNSKALIQWHKKALDSVDVQKTYKAIVSAETAYQYGLLQQLNGRRPPKEHQKTQAQLVFCIDVRSEPFRRAIEAQGNFETYGFAGFFGLPVSISNPVTGESHASCPVLLNPAYDISEIPDHPLQSCKQRHNRLQGLKKLYQSLKYTFTIPFSLVEAIGSVSGLWMATRSFAPAASSFIQSSLKNTIEPDHSVTPDVDAIPTGQQVALSAGVLKMMGLTENFAPLVVFCGHGSTTENNAFASALECGACGGHHGAPNARALAKILNREVVRIRLRDKGIDIPEGTLFIAAEHNTTTDEVEIYSEQIPALFAKNVRELKDALQAAQYQNNWWRSAQMDDAAVPKRAKKAAALRAKDWAEVRPEWGLAKNASFIVGPRWLTQNVNLEGRSFLHSYEWEKDPDGRLLASILTAPLVVGQWINAQYLFSTLDNVAFGAGSKVTQNVTGKIGVMQGNASDLMTGLPLESVFQSDTKPYHTPIRLTAVVYAPKGMIYNIVEQQEILQKLCGNGWVHLVCYDPDDHQKYRLECNLSWAAIY